MSLGESLTLQLKRKRHSAVQSIDLRALLTPEMRALSLTKARALVEQEGLPARICPHQLAIVKTLYVYCDDKLVHGTTGDRVYSAILCLRRFMQFVNEHMESFALDDAAEALRRYNNYWINQVETNQAAQHTASAHVLTVSRVLALACGMPWEELRLKVDLIAQTRYSPPEDNKNAEIQAFVLDMGDIIDSISSSVLELRDPITITFKARRGRQEQSVRLSRQGIPPSSELPYLHIQAVQLRIEAEYKRFITLTGMNPAAVDRLLLEDIRLESGAGRLKAAQFKVRADKTVKVGIPANYTPSLKKHIKFIESLPSYSAKQPRLFPALVGAFQKKSNPLKDWKDVRFHVFGYFKTIMKRVGRPWFNGRELRRNKGVYTLRKTGGDALIASRLLNNTPSMAARHYGGQGNRAENEVEMTTYFQHEIEASQARITKSTDPGGCVEPRAPTTIAGAPPEVNPQCGAANSCFFCTKYRAIETPKYIHEIITLRYQLRMREGGSIHNEQTIMTLKRINQIISDYSRISGRHAKEVEQLSEMVSRERFAELHQNAIELEEILEQ